MMNKKLREIKFITGTAGSGKTQNLLKDYINIAKKENAAFISFDGGTSSNDIPIQNINASVNFINYDGDSLVSSDFIQTMNDFIKKYNLDHLFLDAPAIVIGDKCDEETLFFLCNQLKCNIYVTHNIKRESI